MTTFIPPYGDVDTLQADIVLVDGTPWLPPEKVAHWRGRFAPLRGQERDRRAQELLAVAVKFHRGAGDAATALVLALLDLASSLIAGGSDDFAQAAAKLIGADAPRRATVPASPPPGAMSVWSARLQNHPPR